MRTVGDHLQDRLREFGHGHAARGRRHIADNSHAFTGTHQRFWDQARRRLGDRDGTRVLIDVLLGHRTIDANAIVAGMDAALAAGVVDAEVVLIEARRSAENTDAQVIPIGTHTRFDRPEPTIDHYDDLLEGNT